MQAGGQRKEKGLQDGSDSNPYLWLLGVDELATKQTAELEVGKLEI